MKKILISAAFTLIVFIIFTGCNKKNNKITITGSTTLLPVAQKCAEEFMKSNGNKVNINVSGGGSGVGITALLDGRTDIADSSRKIKESEVQDFKNKNIIPYEYEIAKDALAIIIHPDLKSIKNLSLTDLKKIYTGKIKSWAELGGPNKPIVVISRDTSSGTYETFESIVMEKQKIVSESLMLASNNAVATTVATTPFSIGYIGLGYINASDIKILSIDNTLPSKDTVLNKKYKISRGLYMYTNGEAQGNIKTFIDFILSSSGQKIIEGEGFIPIK
jgi:phosphate transport system substrate-binding protein